jgi:hypothetical protein
MLGNLTVCVAFFSALGFSSLALAVVRSESAYIHVPTVQDKMWRTLSLVDSFQPCRIALMSYLPTKVEELGLYFGSLLAVTRPCHEPGLPIAPQFASGSS